MKKGWHKYLVYLSLIFLVFALYRANYLQIPTVHSWGHIVLSFAFLFAGFLAQVWTWFTVLKQSNYPINYPTALAGTGLSVFTKFIPGKIMIIVGRAAYAAEAYGYTVGKLSSLSLNTQLIALWSGLTTGTIGLFFLEGFGQWRWLIIGLFVFLSILIFNTRANKLVEMILSKMLKKNINLPQLKPSIVVKILPIFFIYWLCWATAFYFLAKGLSLSPNISFLSGLSFPLATTLGIMAIIAPGGIGVREGILVGCLTLSGVAPAEAATISVSSRLWFFVGESFIFILGWIVDRLRTKNVTTEIAQETV